MRDDDDRDDDDRDDDDRDDDDRDDDDRDDDFEGLIDPDVDVDDRVEAGASSGDLRTVLVIAVGGVLGAEARYGLGRALPHTARDFPWSTLLINLTGCALLGVLMVVVLEMRTTHRLLRPFVGVGVLGGYTTFSSFAVDVQNLVDAHRAALALGDWVLTLAGGWLATWSTIAVTRRLGARQVSTCPS